MIDQIKINRSWIETVSKANRNADKILVEKVIRALLLLEGLVKQNIPFVFKGGTALMLLLNSDKRLSIDIDIIIEVKLNNLDQLLDNVAAQQGFIRKEKQDRIAHTQIEKTHYKFFYTPLHQTRENEEFVLLDILFENIQYQSIEQHEIRSVFLPQLDQPLLVNIPSFEDITADKLTAFAPNTTGIPYWKGADSMSMEIIKQLYDLGNLVDHVAQIDVLKNTFEKIALTEIDYRPEKALSINDVLEDIFQTSLCIATRGIIGKGNFKELQEGIRRITGFIYSESYHIEKAITHASKTAYLSILIKAGSTEIQHFNSPNEIENWTIGAALHSKLNKLKKSNPEAFFYWYQIEQLL
ncbi:MAG: nucleotidyl transferase AbiEii/AbiGii toxin family protein [Prolixibacteraceae bacterium]